MRRTPLKRRRTTPRRTTSPRCETLRCSRPAAVLGLCTSHAEMQADRLFSRWIRDRDRRCTANFVHDCTGANMLHAAHVVGRRNSATRFDPRNVHALCPGAHMLVDQHGREGIKYDWAISRIGEVEFEALRARAAVPVKRQAAIVAALLWLRFVRIDPTCRVCGSTDLAVPWSAGDAWRCENCGADNHGADLDRAATERGR